MVTKRLVLAASLLFVGSQTMAADLFPFWEKCAFKCKAIPPLEESLLTKGEAAHPAPDFPDEQTAGILPGNKLVSGLTPVPARTYNMVVWNIYKMRKDYWEEDYKAHTKDADLVLLQEAVMGTDKDPVFNAIEHWDLAVSFYQKDDTLTGVMTGSSSKSIESLAIRTEDREPFSNTPKMSLTSLYKLASGQELLVINIHGINFRRLKGLERQLEQTEPLLRTHNGPVIFAGDFNTKTQKRRDYLDEFFARFGMKRIIWPEDDRNSMLNLDHVYYRGLQIENAVMLQNMRSSDHPMLKVSFQG